MRPTNNKTVTGFVEMLGRARIPCRIHSVSATGALLELLERAHLLPTIGLRIADGHRVLECDVTSVDRSNVRVNFKQADGIEGAAIKRAIRNAQDAFNK